MMKVDDLKKARDLANERERALNCLAALKDRSVGIGVSIYMRNHGTVFSVDDTRDYEPIRDYAIARTTITIARIEARLAELGVSVEAAL